ncbi:hypothetical protein NLU13_8946 [Sarocladium strictum]|uniref:Ankyrin n=1 Tax=Sarocladium strictum TaxID=5046 RepID=A0AA39L3W5_SARSR|nr:hypothetical protein NLU13_8946 [Sarocladium strictum]
MTYTASNLRKAWFWATEAGGKFVIALLRTLQTKRHSLLSLDNPSSSSSLSRSWTALQLVLSADQETQLTEHDLDFIFGLLRSGTSPDEGDLDTVSSTTSIPMWNGGSLALDTATTDPEQGYTAIELSLNLGRLEILKILLDSRAVRSIGHIHRSGASCLHFAIKKRFSDAVPLLLSCLDVPVNHLDGSGRTVLHYAILQDDIKLVKQILDCPRVVAETPSQDRRTALHYAALSARDDLVSLLLSTGSFDPEHRDSYGKNAHDWAVHNSSPKVAMILRDYVYERAHEDTGVADQIMAG